MCQEMCKQYYEPVDERYYKISCRFCKEFINESMFPGSIRTIRFICDKSHTPLQFGRVCYRYRNWYGENSEYIYYSEKNPYFDFMKLTVDSNEIVSPVVYEATVCYEGLSENENPLWIILDIPQKIEELYPYDMDCECEFRGLHVCEGCGLCEEL